VGWRCGDNEIEHALQQLGAGLLVAAGVVAVGLCGLCAAQFARGPTVELLTLIAMITTPGVMAGVGLILLGRRLGWRKTDGVQGAARAFRLACAAAMVAVGLLGCSFGLIFTLSAFSMGALAVIAAVAGSAAGAGIFWGGLLLWPDRKPPIRIDDVF
jgi:hypothetical protein